MVIWCVRSAGSIPGDHKLCEEAVSDMSIFEEYEKCEMDGDVTTYNRKIGEMHSYNQCVIEIAKNTSNLEICEKIKGVNKEIYFSECVESISN